MTVPPWANTKTGARPPALSTLDHAAAAYPGADGPKSIRVRGSAAPRPRPNGRGVTVNTSRNTSRLRPNANPSHTWRASAAPMKSTSGDRADA